MTRAGGRRMTRAGGWRRMRAPAAGWRRRTRPGGRAGEEDARGGGRGSDGRGWATYEGTGRRTKGGDQRLNEIDRTREIGLSVSVLGSARKL